MKHIVVCAGDLHCGSTVGLCPPEGLELDDDGLYLPSKAQNWLWNNWEEAWGKIKSVKRKKLMVQMNLKVGDFTTWLGAGGGFYICENGILVQNPNLGVSNG